MSGPSGAGKDTVITAIHERGEPFATPVNLTTRAPREGEVDGIDYRFVTAAEFQRNVEAGEMLEHAQVYADMKGVARSEVRRALATGNDVILRVDIQGAETLRERLSGALLIFIIPDDLAQMETRMRERGMDETDIQQRMKTTQHEIAAQEGFDHVVENIDGDLGGTIDRVLAIIATERARPGREAVQV
ncbi:MAG TPA: guanylate kinase [Dehalococcoidia bacterium]|nr:guanylate kinase [Dehalococcoidia bacterium]